VTSKRGVGATWAKTVTSGASSMRCKKELLKSKTHKKINPLQQDPSRKLKVFPEVCIFLTFYGNSRFIMRLSVFSHVDAVHALTHYSSAIREMYFLSTLVPC
jgi:hypothetical protein